MRRGRVSSAHARRLRLGPSSVAPEAAAGAALEPPERSYRIHDPRESRLRTDPSGRTVRAGPQVAGAECRAKSSAARSGRRQLRRVRHRSLSRGGGGSGGSAAVSYRMQRRGDVRQINIRGQRTDQDAGDVPTACTAIDSGRMDKRRRARRDASPVRETSRKISCGIGNPPFRLTTTYGAAAFPI